MPHLSPRLTNMTPGGSDGWEIVYQTHALQAQGVDVIELTVGEHDIGTDRVILEAMHDAALAGHTGYAAVPGIGELRAEVAARVTARTGVETGPENIYITPGGQAGLFATHLAVCPEGAKALYVDPYYATYPGTLRGVGARDVAVRAHPEDGFQPRAADIEAEAEGAVSLLINSPNNPTGVVYTEETLRGIADVCVRHDMWLISDEVYDTQVWNGAHLSPRALPGMADRTLVIGSMSKSHAMTGSRIGWVVGPQDAIAHLANLATHTTYGVAGFIQDAALFALRQGAAFEAKIAAPFERRRQIALKILAGQNAVRVIPSDGAMYVMLDIRDTGLSGRTFAERLLAEEQIAVMPGESFGHAAAGHVRVAMTIEDGRFAEALTRLVTFAQGLCA